VGCGTDNETGERCHEEVWVRGLGQLSVVQVLISETVEGESVFRASQAEEVLELFGVGSNNIAVGEISIILYPISIC
jgi:hypothetical protein